MNRLVSVLSAFTWMALTIGIALPGAAGDLAVCAAVSRIVFGGFAVAFFLYGLLVANDRELLALIDPHPGPVILVARWAFMMVAGALGHYGIFCTALVFSIGVYLVRSIASDMRDEDDPKAALALPQS